MTLFAWTMFLVSFVAIPVIWVLIDRAPTLIAGFAGAGPVGGEPVEDFEVLVPIYGSVRYLENVDYLRQYGDRVLLCTTNGESGEFYAELSAIAAANGFRVYRAAAVAGGIGADGKRATSGAARDMLVREALEEIVKAPYVVCIDADSITDEPFGELVGMLAANGYDFASVPLVPTNTESVLGRLQAYEYRSAMKLRRIAPWQVSGACHAGRTAAHREIMRRHSLFFQGNDVEAGLLAKSLGMRVGHLPFAVRTAVPDTLRSWYRQRLAWSGGEFRLFVMNLHLLVRHPVFWTYGAIVTTLGLPFRWLTLATGGWTLMVIFGLHALATVAVHWSVRTRWLALLPLYSLFNSLIMTPLGAVWYARMAIADRNAGFIRTRRAVTAA